MPPSGLFALAVTGLALLTMAGGCSVAQAPAERQPAASASTLDRSRAEAVAVKADAARRAAFAGLDPGALLAAFRGKALRVLQAQVRHMRDRGLRLEERNPVLAVVFWDAHAAEVVLQVEAQHRLLTLDQADPPWGTTVRQWWSRLAREDGEWWVVDQADLAPDHWRSP
jgi:hypothetical protein